MTGDPETEIDPVPEETPPPPVVEPEEDDDEDDEDEDDEKGKENARPANYRPVFDPELGIE